MLKSGWRYLPGCDTFARLAAAYPTLCWCLLVLHMPSTTPTQVLLSPCALPPFPHVPPALPPG